MNLWVITVAEPLPIDDGNDRAKRSGLLVRALCERGHNVLWWTSTFKHFDKVHRAHCDQNIRVNENLSISMLHGTGYRHNLSLSRLFDHGILGAKFLRQAARARRPDVILVSLPTLEFAAAASRFASRHGIPIVVDVRDLWPDIFLDAVPDYIRFALRSALVPYGRLANYACAKASSIVAPVAHYIEWALSRARRARSELDREFPFGYSATPPSEQLQQEALQFWSNHGIHSDSSEFLVCFIGNLGRQFDLTTVIRAARSLENNQPRIRFVICGTGDAAKHYRQLAGSSTNIVFPGWINGPQIWTLLRLSSVGLAPYLRVPNFTKHIPNKPIEYLSAGLPIATPLSGCALGDMILNTRCGVVYEAASDQSLASILRELSTNPRLLQTLSSNAAALFQEQYRAEQVYSNMARHLELVSTFEYKVQT